MTYQFQERYNRTLEKYFFHPEEEYLEEAYRMGQELVAAQYYVEDIGAMHTLAAEWLARQHPEANIDERGHIPLVETLMAYGMAARAQVEWLGEQKEALECEIAERVRAEEALHEAQEQLVRRERLAVLGQLAGGVAHELRNPLGVIKNAAYFLNMVGQTGFGTEEPEPEVKETLEILEKEVATSERIISSLLDFARPKPPLRRKVGVNDIVQAALSHTDVPENVEVATQLDETLPTILADPDQLERVFGNIILNAVQAMALPRPIGTAEGGQLVVRSEAPSPEWVAISFADTGVGIPEKNLDKIFEPLFTTKAKGIGLGLALVRTLVEGHGGTVEVQSEVGKGSTFTVKLPISGREKK